MQYNIEDWTAIKYADKCKNWTLKELNRIELLGNGD